MYYDLTWDHGKMRYECALPKILKFVTSLSFNEFKSMKILFHGPKRITQKKLFDNENYQGVFCVKHPSSSIKRQSKKGNIPQSNYNICHFDIQISVLCVTTTIAI